MGVGSSRRERGLDLERYSYLEAVEIAQGMGCEA